MGVGGDDRSTLGWAVIRSPPTALNWPMPILGALALLRTAAITFPSSLAVPVIATTSYARPK
jgi:hypothetical protein